MGVAVFKSEKCARLNRMRGSVGQSTEQPSYALACIVQPWLNYSPIQTSLNSAQYIIGSLTAGFVPVRPQRLDFDGSEREPSLLEDVSDKRSSFVPTPPERGERRYKNNNHGDHHVAKVPVNITTLI